MGNTRTGIFKPCPRATLAATATVAVADVVAEAVAVPLCWRGAAAASIDVRLLSRGQRDSSLMLSRGCCPHDSSLMTAKLCAEVSQRTSLVDDDDLLSVVRQLGPVPAVPYALAHPALHHRRKNKKLLGTRQTTQARISPGNMGTVKNPPYPDSYSRP